MKGTDCTPAQIEAARQFILRAAHGGPAFLDDAKSVTIAVRDLVRVVAWYGAMRYIASRDGLGGTLEHPGEFVIHPPADAAKGA